MLVLTFITIIGLSQGALYRIPAPLEWVPVTNGVNPPSSVHVGTEESFCEVDDTKGLIPGVTNNGKCEYEVDGEVKSSSSYNVLVRPEGVHTGWKYSSGQPPVGAVKCHEGSQCYLGMSIYTDGLCEELPGKIFADKKQMIMTSGEKVYKCPSKLYLVEKMIRV
ncbi:hypothetical protein SNE40_018015 [Patella caerulea]|uniref:Secreted protein n=1 Tax=Patella caerulea TaxID=87958 RepID=A0AAN8J7M6_PATCE